MKSRIVAVLAAAVLAIAVPVALVSSHASAGTVSRGCVVTEIGYLAAGDIPTTYPMTFCGAGIHDQVITCPRKSYRTASPGAIMKSCTVVYYPNGFPAWMVPWLVPAGY